MAIDRQAVIDVVAGEGALDVLVISRIPPLRRLLT